MAADEPGVHRIEATAATAGVRVDVFLAKHLPSLSRSRIQQLAKAGLIKTGGKPAKPGAVVTEGLIVEIEIPENVMAAPESQNLPVDVMYQDADLVVVNKPVGMVVHPGAGHASGTLVNALLHHIKDLSGIGGTERPGIVHRLDRGTSGVMIVAKHDRAHRHLSAQFHDRTVTKEYVALVWGHPAVDLHMDRAIGRHPVHRQKMSGRSRHGRSAVTTVTDAERLGPVSLIRLTIGTGRTHQIRVHLSEAGFPIVGDQLYGGTRRQALEGGAVLKGLDRPLLHAARIAFDHPADRRRLTFDAPLDRELAAIVDTLRMHRDATTKDTQ